MEWLLNADKELFLTINGLHTPFLDGAMMLFTASAPWIPLYILTACYIIYKYWIKEKRALYALAIITAIVLTFALTDMGSSFVKDLVKRPRPGHEPLLEGMVRLLDGKGGAYGYFSSHAANVFGYALITAALFKKRWYTLTIFTWALIVSYSRIYVGRHYPTDVISGALFGLAAASLLLLCIKSSFIKKITKPK